MILVQCVVLCLVKLCSIYFFEKIIFSLYLTLFWNSTEFFHGFFSDFLFFRFFFFQNQISKDLIVLNGFFVLMF